ncbi:manganese transport protein MntH [Mycobacteroides abscessus subsp. abscessus]|nr:manganese transport protein MntH [Mycobacteroides abscessus subsp. abscessus]
MLERQRQARPLRGLSLLGPAFVAAIAYVDPGNVASNVSAGAKYGFLLVWVIVTANVMAGLVQYLSAKLGLVTGQSLPEAIGDRMARPTRLTFWLQAELVAMATDLAEVVGGAIALHLLFGLPLLLGGVITGIVSMALLTVQDRRGQRSFEYVISALLAIIAIGFLASVVVEPPPLPEAAAGLIPHFQGTESLLLAQTLAQTDRVADPLMYDKSYYLEPDSKSSKSYVLLAQTLAQTDRVAIVHFALRNKTRLAALRVKDFGERQVMIIHTLLWPDEIREPDFPVLDQEVKIKPAELAMAGQVVESMADDFDPSRYNDTYQSQLLEMVEAKLEGGEAFTKEEAPTELDATDVSDLLAKLEASVKKRQAEKASTN